MLRDNREGIIRGDMDARDVMDDCTQSTLSTQSTQSTQSTRSTPSINHSKAMARTIINTKPDNSPTVGISVPRR